MAGVKPVSEMTMEELMTEYRSIKIPLFSIIYSNVKQSESDSELINRSIALANEIQARRENEKRRNKVVTHEEEAAMEDRSLRKVAEHYQLQGIELADFAEDLLADMTVPVGEDGRYEML